MIRKLFAFATLAVVCGAVAASADEPTPGQKKRGPGDSRGADKGKQFAKLDTDGDGSLSKAEFAKFAEEIAKRFANKGGKEQPRGGADFAGKMFERMDTNGDGKISKDEFEKTRPSGRRPGGKDGPRGKGRPDAPKKAAE
jgi:hypothetical protein